MQQNVYYMSYTKILIKLIHFFKAVCSESIAEAVCLDLWTQETALHM